MKKLLTTFIIALMGVTFLTGCGNSQQKAVSELKKDNRILHQQLDEQGQRITDLEKQDQRITDSEESVDKSSTTETILTEESGNAEDSTKIAVPDYPDVIKEISLKDEKIQVTVIYNGEAISVVPQTEENRDKAFNDPLILNLPAGGRMRDISLMISGVTVKNVYIVDKQFEELDSLAYDTVDNTYLAYYYMPGAGQYNFLITTINGSHYYISVIY